MSLINDISSLIDYDPSIQINWIQNLDKVKSLNQTYVITDEVNQLMVNILKTILGSAELLGKSKQHSHFIVAQYGKGKSRFMLTLMNLLKFSDQEINKPLIDKLVHFPEISVLTKELVNYSHIVAFANANAFRKYDFAYLLYSCIKNATSEQNPELLQQINRFDFLIDLIRKQTNRIIQFESEFSEKAGFSSKIAIEKLKARDIDCYNNVHEVMTEILGIPQLIDEVSISDLIRDVAKELEKNDLKLCIFIDELTNFIRNSSATRDSIYADLQEMAESIETNGKDRITFVGSLHKTIEETFEMSDEEIEKIKGRFMDHSDLANFSFEQIVSSVIKTPVSADSILLEKDSSSIKIIKNVHKEFRFKSQDFLSYYPFHPATIYYLSFISEYSNASRTALNYVLKALQEKLKEPIFIQEKLNLILPDTLWESFSEVINEKRQSLAIALNDTLEIAETNEEKSIVELLGVSRACHDISTGIHSGLSYDEIASYLLINRSLVDEIRNRFDEDSKFIIADDKKMSIDPTGVPSIQEELKLEFDNMPSVNQLLSDRLRIHLNLRNELEWLIEWKNIIYFIFDLDLNQDYEVLSEKNDCLIFLIENEESEALMKKLWGNSQKYIQNASVIILNSKINRELAKMYFAHYQLSNKSEDPLKQRSIEKGFQRYKKQFEEHLEEILSIENVSIFNEDEEKNYSYYDEQAEYIIDLSGLIEIIALDTIEKRYPRLVKLDSGAQHIRDNVSWLNSIVKQFNETKVINLGTMDGVGRNVIEGHFLSLDLYEKGESKKHILPKIPSKTKDSTGNEIAIDMQTISETNKSGCKRDLVQFCKKYKSPPFGLNTILISLYVLWISWKFDFIIESTQQHVPKKQFRLNNISDLTQLTTDIRDYINKFDGKGFYLISPEKVPKQTRDKIKEICSRLLPYSDTFQVDIITDIQEIFQKSNESITNLITSSKSYLDEIKCRYDGFSTIEAEICKEIEKLDSVLKMLNEEISPLEFFENRLPEIGSILYSLSDHPGPREIVNFIDKLKNQKQNYVDFFKNVDLLNSVINILTDGIEVEKELRTETEKIIFSISLVSFDNLKEKLNNKWVSIFKEYIEKYTVFHDEINNKRTNILNNYLESCDFIILEELSSIDFESLKTSEKLKSKWKSEYPICNNILVTEQDVICVNCKEKVDQIGYNSIVKKQETAMKIALIKFLSYWSKKMLPIKAALQSTFDVSNTSDLEKFISFYNIMNRISEVSNKDELEDICLTNKEKKEIKNSIGFIKEIYALRSQFPIFEIPFNDFLNVIISRTKERFETSKSSFVNLLDIKKSISQEIELYYKELAEDHKEFQIIM